MRTSFRPEPRKLGIGNTLFRLAPLAGAVMSASLVAPKVDAAVVYAITPSLIVAAVQDNNLFLTAEPAIEDRSVRYTGALDLSVVGDALTLTANYSQDAEYYEDYDQFDSSDLRRSGIAHMEYQVTERFSWGLDGSYFTTPQPGDLNLAPGGIFADPSVIPGLTPPTGIVQLGRVPTTRRAVRGNIDFSASPTLDTHFSYGVARDETAVGIGGDIAEGRAEFEKGLSARNTLLVGYTYREFEFSNGTGEDSHTVMAGVEHRLSPVTTVRVAAGPRFYADSVEPNIEASLNHEFATGLVTASYSRSETLLAGSDTRVESHTAMLVLSKRFGQHVSVNVQPAWARIDSPLGAVVDVFQLSADAMYRFNDYVAVSASAQLSRQDEDIVGGFDRDVPRDIYTVALHFSWPIRGERP